MRLDGCAAGWFLFLGLSFCSLQGLASARQAPLSASEARPADARWLAVASPSCCSSANGGRLEREFENPSAEICSCSDSQDRASLALLQVGAQAHRQPSRSNPAASGKAVVGTAPYSEDTAHRLRFQRQNIASLALQKSAGREAVLGDSTAGTNLSNSIASMGMALPRPRSHAPTAEVSAFARVASLLTAKGAEVVAATVDDSDRSWILICVLVGAFLFAIKVFFLYTDMDDPQHEHMNPAAQHLLQRAQRMMIPAKATKEPPKDPKEVQPTISAKSTKPVLPNSEIGPLLLSVQALEKLGAASSSSWSMPVLSTQKEDPLSRQKKVMYTATMGKVASGHRRLLLLVGKSDDGKSEQVYASIDSAMVIRNASGTPFGRLVVDTNSKDGGFILDEESSPQCRWVFKPEIDETLPGLKGLSMNITTRPLGKVIGSIARSSKPSRLVRSPDKEQEDFLQVTSGDGIDMTLVLICALGVFAFEMAPPQKEEPPEAKAKGFARGAFDWLH